MVKTTPPPSFGGDVWAYPHPLLAGHQCLGVRIGGRSLCGEDVNQRMKFYQTECGIFEAGIFEHLEFSAFLYKVVLSFFFLMSFAVFLRILVLALHLVSSVTLGAS